MEIRKITLKIRKIFIFLLSFEYVFRPFFAGTQRYNFFKSDFYVIHEMWLRRNIKFIPYFLLLWLANNKFTQRKRVSNKFTKVHQTLAKWTVVNIRFCFFIIFFQVFYIFLIFYDFIFLSRQMFYLDSNGKCPSVTVTFKLPAIFLFTYEKFKFFAIFSDWSNF